MNFKEMIIWIDTNNDSHGSFRQKLTENSTEYVKIFTEMEECVKYLQTNLDKTIFLILSHSFASKLVPLIYDFKNIYQIYLFGASIPSHRDWVMNFTDKMLIFDHEDDLFRRLFTEIELFLRQQAQIYMEQAKIFKDRAQSLKQPSCG